MSRYMHTHVQSKTIHNSYIWKQPVCVLTDECITDEWDAAVHAPSSQQVDGCIEGHRMVAGTGRIKRNPERGILKKPPCSGGLQGQNPLRVLLFCVLLVLELNICHLRHQGLTRALLGPRLNEGKQVSHSILFFLTAKFDKEMWYLYKIS